MKLATALVFGAIAGLAEIGLAAALAAYPLAGSGDANAGYAAGALAAALALFVTIAVGLAQLAYAARAGGRALPVGLALLALGLCAALLAPVTFYLSALAFGGAALYAMEAAARGRGGADAIAESGRIATAAPAPTLGALALVAAGILAGALAARVLGGMQPLAAAFAAGLLGQLGIGYAAPLVAATAVKLRAGGGSF